MATVHLSEDVQKSVRRERKVLVERLADLREQSERLHELVDVVDRDAEETARLLRSMDEMLGLAPQLSIDSIHEELRGRKLQEMAVRLLRQKREPGTVVHYREWFELVAETGVRIAGKDPLATFLTQVARAPAVESVRPRSGLYRLRSA